jgi:CRP/FNR family transcriptional regulator, anaerobic regulatory protein
MSASVPARRSQESQVFSDLPKQKPASSKGFDGIELKGPVRVLSGAEFLFRAGDRKTHIFRVETGTICVYGPRWREDRSVVEFAFPGDFVGLGYLQTHTSSARAMLEARVTSLPLSAVDRIVARNPSARDGLIKAIERELEFVRKTLVQSGNQNALERVAALFIFLSRNNQYEGRDPNIIPDSLTCGAVANYLGFNIDVLSCTLMELEQRGLIERCFPSGLRLKDLTAIERLAGASSEELALRSGAE